MKETYYFSHDYNASQDPKILNMLSELKFEGYGLYWALIEKLAEANGKLLLSDLKGLSFIWQIDEEKLICLSGKFNLFDNDGVYFWSNRLLEHLKHRDNLSKIRAKIGRKGGVAKANQLPSNCQAKAKQNVAKERKGKESKINNISTIVDTANAENVKFGNEDINWLIGEFELVMKFKSAGGKNDRFMAKHLLNNFSRQQLTAMLTYCATQEYAPRVGSVEKLWYKRADIIAGIKSLKNSKKIIQTL